jgi:hypothetical protein
MADIRTGFDMVICEKDWDNYTDSQKNWMLFNTLRSIDERLAKVEKQSTMHKTFAFFGGVVGGAAAAFGIKFWA